MCPKSWQDQYDLTQDSLPQSVRKLLGIANSNAKEKAAKENTEKATRKGKRKGTNSNEF